MRLVRALASEEVAMSSPTPQEDRPAELPGFTQALARTLRHEIGDFLQKVYATVAILNARLPADGSAMEREILTRLKAGAESCKRLIDAVQDYLSPLTLAREPVDVSHLADQLVTAARGRCPNLQLTADAAGPALAFGDPRRLAQLGEVLLTNACEAAGSRVTVATRLNPAAREVEWVVTDDGPGVADDVAPRLFSPFFSTRAAHAGLGLALARKIVQLHGGRLSAGNLPGGGFRATASLPMASTSAGNGSG